MSLESGEVSNWRATNNRDLSFSNATLGNRPTYIASSSLFNNQACLDFDGSNDNLTCNVALSTLITASAGTVLMVLYPENVTGGSVPFVWVSTTAAGTHMGFRFVSTNARSDNVDSGGLDAVTRAITINTLYKAEWRHAGGTLYCKINSSQGSAASGDTIASELSNMPVLGRHVGGSLDAKLAEIVFLNQDMTAGDRTAWDAYVLDRYGI